MALKIIYENEVFDLNPNQTTDIEDNSPIFNERGSQTSPNTFPSTSHNRRLMDFINRLDIESAPEKDMRVVVADDIYRRSGKLNITQASREGIVANIGFDESEIYNLWSEVTFRNLENLPEYSPAGGLNDVVYYLNQVLNDQLPEAPFHIFRICMANPSREIKEDKKEETVYYPEYLNDMKKENGKWVLKSNARTEVFLLDNEEVNTELPAGYGIAPFLKVSWLVEYIFSYYGYKLIDSPLKKHPQFSRMVVLNNAADCIVKGVLKYADLFPDCTINEFFQALYCRFGLVYFVNGQTKTVRLKFVKEIIQAPASDDWTLFRASEPIINYSAPTQLRLSAGTSIEGASTASDNFVQFLAKNNYSISTLANSGYLFYDKVSGYYKRKNLITSVIKNESSDFFSWDRESKNYQYHEITSPDESLPIFEESDYNEFFCPFYAVGKVHRYTTISSSDVTISEKEKKTTPLSFCFAHPLNSYTYPFGSPRCFNPDGKMTTDIYGNTFDISITFWGDQGLFKHFWKEYDAVLRWANHSIELDMNLNLSQILNMDYSLPVAFCGQRLLPDVTNYMLPKRKSDPVSLKLRTIKLLKPYDLSEQEIHSDIATQTGWQLVSYANQVMDDRIAELNAQNTFTLYTHSYKKIVITEPKVQDFDSLLPPTEEEVNAGKELLKTYMARLEYKLTYSSGGILGDRFTSKQKEDITYQGGFKAVGM